MLRGLYTAYTGMEAQQQKMDIVSNNLANANTTGFKKNNIEFQDMLYQKMQVATRERPVNIEVGTGARLSSTMVDFSQGILEQVENPFSLAIDGMGFFRVQLPNGDVGYSRNGAFNLNADNVLVTADGYKVLDSSGAEIELPSPFEDVQVTETGEVFVKEVGNADFTSVGVLGLTTFPNPSGLEKKGGSVYMPNVTSGDPIDGEAGEEGFGKVRQRFLERSNVQVVDEMIKMITSQRAYEISTKMIQTSDDILQMTNNLKR